MSKFTSILKDIGLVVAQAGLTYVGLGELANKLIKTTPPPPGVVPTKLQDIWDLVKKSEFIANTIKDITLTGDQKRAMITPEITNMVMTIDDFAGRAPEDPELFKQSIDGLVSSIVGIGNSFKKK